MVFYFTVQGLLCIRPENRISSLSQMQGTKLMANINFKSLAEKKLPPPFVPDNQGKDGIQPKADRDRAA